MKVRKIVSILIIFVVAILMLTTAVASVQEVSAASKVSVKWDGNGGKIGTAKTITTKVNNGAKITKLPTTPKKAGYVFSGWYTKKSGGIKITTATKVKKKATYYAQWKKQYTLNFDANGGNVSPKSKKLTNKQSYGTLPTPKRSGYTFDGWYTSKTGGTKVSTTTKMTAKKVIVYAQWKKVAINNNSTTKNEAVNSNSTTKNETVNNNSTITVPAPSAPTSFTSTATVNNVSFSWNAVVGATGYQVYRATSENGIYTLVKTTTNTNFVDSESAGTGLVSGTSYYYKVRAYKEQDGQTAYSGYSSVENNGVIRVSISFGGGSLGYSNGQVVSFTQSVTISTSGGKGGNIVVTEILSSTYPGQAGETDRRSSTMTVSNIGQTFTFNRVLHLYNNGPQSSNFMTYTIICDGASNNAKGFPYSSAKFNAGGNWGIPYNPGW